MEKEALRNLQLKIVFDDGREVFGGYDMDANAFCFSPKIFEAKHDIAHLLKVVGINEDSLIHVTYIFDGDYLPRHFYFRVNEQLRIEDHVEVSLPHFDHSLQHITIILQFK